MCKRFLRLLVTTVIAVSMIAPTVVFADDAPVSVEAIDEDVKEDVKEDIVVSGDSAVTAVAQNGYKAEATTKNVESTSDDGVYINANGDGSKAVVTVDGSAVGSSGVVVDSCCYDANVSVTVNGDVKATGSESGYGIFVDAWEGAEVTTTVEGDVTGAGTGLRIICEESDTIVNAIINGDVTSKNAHGIFVNAEDADESGITNVFVGGDVSGSEYGIKTKTKNGGSTNIVVEGTVHGKVTTSGEGDNNISVWKVETDDKASLSKDIRYIVKVDQPAGATLRATDSNGKALATVDAANGKSYEYALQGDKVLLKIDVNDGYNLDAVYGDDGKQYVLGKDASGNYYIMVPAGGGVKFSAVLSQKGNDKGDDDDDKKEETPVVVNIAQNAPVFTNTATVAAAVTEAAVQAAVTSVTETPAGGTANIALSSSTVDASVVRMLIARRDINVSLACFVNGQLCNIMIPAGADLSDILNPDGTIDIEKLAKKFGKTEVK